MAALPGFKSQRQSSSVAPFPAPPTSGHSCQHPREVWPCGVEPIFSKLFWTSLQIPIWGPPPGCSLLQAGKPKICRVGQQTGDLALLMEQFKCEGHLLVAFPLLGGGQSLFYSDPRLIARSPPTSGRAICSTLSPPISMLTSFTQTTLSETVKILFGQISDHCSPVKFTHKNELP